MMWSHSSTPFTSAARGAAAAAAAGAQPVFPLLLGVLLVPSQYTPCCWQNLSNLMVFIYTACMDDKTRGGFKLLQSYLSSPSAAANIPIFIRHKYSSCICTYTRRCCIMLTWHAVLDVYICLVQGLQDLGNAAAAAEREDWFLGCVQMVNQQPPFGRLQNPQHEGSGVTQIRSSVLCRCYCCCCMMGCSALWRALQESFGSNTSGVRFCAVDTTRSC